ncbi:Complement Component C7 [Manis pentadactyla]|nr:Complement Component C7 [Manis pentadactyla]
MQAKKGGDSDADGDEEEEEDKEDKEDREGKKIDVCEDEVIKIRWIGLGNRVVELKLEPQGMSIFKKTP